MPSLPPDPYPPGFTAERVYFNGRFLGQRVTGVQRYARETLAALDELLGSMPHAERPAWTVLVPQGTRAPALRHLSVRACGRLKSHAWEQIELPWHSRGGLLYSFGFTGPVLKRRQVITVHDAAVVRMPDTFHPLFRHAYRWMVSHIGRRAPLTVTVSRFSAGEATACFGIPPERLRISTEGWQHLQRVQPDESLLDSHSLRGKPYVLAVSSPTPNKNFAAIAKALGQLGAQAPRAVIVGAADGAVFKATDGATTAPDHLIRVGYVTDAQLIALYKHATCFVFPSFYEGFGIPPLEAMALGCPVLASTAGAVRETCDTAAIYFDPHDPAALAQTMQQLFNDSALQATLREQGRARAQVYSWKQAATLNLALIQEALDLSLGTRPPAR